VISKHTSPRWFEIGLNSAASSIAKRMIRLLAVTLAGLLALSECVAMVTLSAAGQAPDVPYHTIALKKPYTGGRV
jgi:hypothetical protein